MDNKPEKEKKAKKTNQHAWNETLKFSWGHIVAFIALIVMSYMMYMGAFYSNGGDFESAAIKVAIIDVALLCTFIGAQIMKGVDRHFHRSIIIERVLICLCPVAFAFAMIPYNHFWNVYGERHELENQFDSSIKNARLMFAEYDDYCASRFADYSSVLDSLFTETDSLAYANRITKDNYLLALKLQVQSQNTDSLKNLALRWIDESDKGATVWNAFLLGNIEQITAAITDWHNALQAYSAPQMSNESAPASFEASGQAYAEAIDNLKALTEIYTKSKGLNLNALWTGALLMLMLLFPYFLQNRNTKANRYYRLNPYYHPKAATHDNAYIDGETSASAEAWAAVNQGDINAMKVFVMLYPDSAEAEVANKLINKLLDETTNDEAGYLMAQIHQIQARNLTPMMKVNQTLERINSYLEGGRLSKSDFLGIIRADHNLLSAGVVKRLVDQGTITTGDLAGIGIDSKFIQKMLQQEGLATFPTPERLERIHKQSTEVYFWGIPSSGKSCALGAILSVAYGGKVAKSMDPDVNSQGYGYMTKLINLFQHDDIGHLISGTDIDAFYEMGFDLVDQQDEIHPITCIDMAGELMRCMYKKNAGEPMSELDEEMLATMTNVLVDNRSASRKMHIFVIEYGAEDRLYEGLPQRVYLDGALAYIKETGLFMNDTDAVYIMISKADKIKNPTPEAIDRYIRSQYLGFYNGLERICQDNEINNGKVEQIAFSLGDVCFQNYCKFDPRPATRMVNILLDRSASYRGGMRGKFESMFRT